METYLFEPFWNFLANHCLPDRLAPNALTLAGLIMPLTVLLIIGAFDMTFSSVLPNWVWLLGWFALFWY